MELFLELVGLDSAQHLEAEISISTCNLYTVNIPNFVEKDDSPDSFFFGCGGE